MDTNNWRPAQAEQPPPPQQQQQQAPSMDVGDGDWRSQLQMESRQRIVNEIMETLKRHLPFSCQEGLQELKKIAVSFEEKIYTAATSQSDYLRKISLKILTMETKSQNQNPMANSLPSNSVGNGKTPPDSVKRIVMDTNNWRPAQAEPPPPQQQATFMDVGDGDWRSQLQMESRQRIINKIMETLKRHLPFSGEEGLHEMKKIAVRFEEKIYTAATSQSDYLRKISLKMLTMETKSQNQNPMANSLPSNSVGNDKHPPDSDNDKMV